MTFFIGASATISFARSRSRDELPKDILRKGLNTKGGGRGGVYTVHCKGLRPGSKDL